MALKLILGPSGAGKSEYIYDEIIRRTMEDKHENFIVLVPLNSILHWLTDW